MRTHIASSQLLVDQSLATFSSSLKLTTMIANNGMFLSLLFLTWILLEEADGKIGPLASPRVKRNIAQLALLIDDYTPYNSNQLIYHGNWCGYGGNRAQDGSVRDPCDACCKSHDLCYDRLLRDTRESITTVADGIVGYFTERYAGKDGKQPEKKKVAEGWATRSCFPYVDTYDLVEDDPYLQRPICDRASNEGRPCAKEVCKCDTQFVACLRETKCRLRTRTFPNFLF